ncbi:protein-arginine deiminase family protein [Streptomyces sp. NPDC096311]|uniref:protein-arginine deiminase family protein n=1 Tax=Streptomyces sp. NPDC096311 TaxID=3366083 RepID=UPI0038231FA4
MTLREAPLLTHQDLQSAQRVLVARVRGDGLQQTFAENVARQARASGIQVAPVYFTKSDDIWVQDFVEPSYLSVPGPGGVPHTMRIMLRSAQQDRTSGREPYERLRGRDIGVVMPGGMARGEEWTLNSTGNLETIPPYRHNGRDLGRPRRARAAGPAAR